MSQFLETLQLPDGVYVCLPERLYFAQRALGSTDLANLWLYREGWWWMSRWNPWFTETNGKAKLFGSAAHCLLLEGPAAFDARYAVEPDRRIYPDLLVTKDQLISALRTTSAPGRHEYQKIADLAELAKVYLPDRHVWESIMDRFRRQAGNRPVVSAQDRWELQVMLEAAMADDDMRAVVTADGGVRLTEVSVFWTLEDGTRCRFRFDSLLPAANADLKTLGNFRDQDLALAVGKRIGDSALDVQAAWSFEARRQAYAHIEAGRVYVSPPDQEAMPVLATSRPRLLHGEVAWLRRYPAEAPLDLGDEGPGWFWIWMFFQKADNDGRAPVIFPATMTFGSLEHRDGYRKAMAALAFYRAKVAEIGLDKPWTRVAPLHRFSATAARRVVIPHWFEQPSRVAGEEEALRWRA